MGKLSIMIRRSLYRYCNGKTIQAINLDRRNWCQIGAMEARHGFFKLSLAAPQKTFYYWTHDYSANLFPTPRFPAIAREAVRVIVCR